MCRIVSINILQSLFHNGIFIKLINLKKKGKWSFYDLRTYLLQTVELITNKLRLCSEAMVVERDFEKALYDHGIIGTGPESKCVLILERSLLDMAATPDLCQGVFYSFVMQVCSISLFLAHLWCAYAMP